jgi:hypothetical protein
MDKRNAGVIGLIVAILFCGLPGLCLLCAGPINAVIGLTSGEDFMGNRAMAPILGLGIGTLCLSVIFIAIPVAVWYFAIREKPDSEEIVEYDEPIPTDDM